MKSLFSSLVVVILISSSTFQMSDTVESMIREPFLTQLLQFKQLSDSTLIFSDQMKDNSQDYPLGDRVLAQLSIETIIDKLTFSPSDWDSESEIFQNPFNRVKRFGQNQIIFLSILTDFSNDSFLNFIQQLTPPMFPLVKRHQDHFVFMSRSQIIIDQILIHEKIAYKLKYKIGIVIEDSADKKTKEVTSVKTLNLYGSNGQGKIVENFIHSKYSLLDFHKIFPDMTTNLNGKRMILSSIRSSPMMRIRQIIGEDGDEEYVAEGKGGMQYQNFLRVARVMNFTFKIIIASGGGGSGMKLPNGSWNGEIGDVMQGIADVGVLAGINAGRYAVVDFTAFHQYMSLVLLYGPTPPIYSWKALFWPFSPNLWSGIMGAILIVIIFLNIIRPLHIPWPTSNWRPEEHELTIPPTTNENVFQRRKMSQIMSSQRRGERDLSRDTWNFSETIAFVIPSFLLQSYMIPRSDATKTFSIFWFIFIIVISTIYSSKLFGLFVSPPMERAPETMKELAVSNYKIHMTYYGGFLHHWFKTSKNTSSPMKIFKIWHQEHPTVCMKKAFRPKFACIAYYTDFEIMQAGLKVVHGKKKKLIHHHPLEAFEIVLGMVIEKHWILSQSFNRLTGSSFEIGLTGFWAKESGHEDRQAQALLKLSKVKIKYNETDNVWPEPTVTSGTVSLTLLHLTGAFTFFLAGAVIALLSFLSENFKFILQVIPIRDIIPQFKLEKILSFELKKRPIMDP